MPGIATIAVPAFELATIVINSLMKIHAKQSGSSETKQKLEAYQEENAELRKNFEELQEYIKAKELTSFDDLIQHDKEKADALVKLANDTKPFEMEGLNIGLFGQTSTGKSTIINSMLGELVAATGYGETTMCCQRYKSKRMNYTLHDFPGKNDDVSYYTMEYIGFWKSMSKRVIVIEKTVKEMTTVTQLLDAINLHYDLVVNKLDNVPENEIETFKQKIQSEKIDCNLKCCDHIWFISATNITKYDWVQMISALLPNSEH